MRLFWLILASFLGLAATALPASAALQYTLDCSGRTGSVNCSGSQNYGTVTLVQHGSGTALDPYYVTVNVTLAPNEVFADASGYPIAWNIKNNPTLSSVTVTSSNSSFFTVQNFDPSTHNAQNNPYKRYKATPFTGGNCAYNTASCFDYAIAGTWGGTSHHETSLVFDVKKAGGLLISDFDATTSGGYFFSVDIGICKTTNGVTTCNDTFTVGSDDCSPTTVPEPGTWMMAIAGLGLLTMAQRRRKQSRAA
jgi:MYXO-CTERM domain-containing protein